MAALGKGAPGFPVSDQSQELPRKPWDCTMYYLSFKAAAQKSQSLSLRFSTYFFMANNWIKQALPLEKPWYLFRFTRASHVSYKQTFSLKECLSPQSWQWSHLEIQKQDQDGRLLRKYYILLDLALPSHCPPTNQAPIKYRICLGNTGKTWEKKSCSELCFKGFL